MPGLGQQARLFDKLFIGTEGYVFHTSIVYTTFVRNAILPSRSLLRAPIQSVCLLILFPILDANMPAA